MIVNEHLLDDVDTILKSDDRTLLKDFFESVEDWNDTEVVIVCFLDKNGKQVRRVIDTKVPRERIDKIILWGNLFMEEYFRDKSPNFHRELIALNLAPFNTYFAAPRGFSKTTMLQLVISFLCACKEDKYIVLIEKTFMEAAEVLSGIRENFVGNPRLVAVYGDVIKSQENLEVASNIKEHDREGDFYINGVRLKAKGFETSIRGLKSGAWRPTKIFCDDIEKDEHIDNPEQRQKYLDRYQSSIIPAIDVTGAIKMQGTILHLDSLLMNMITNHQGVIYRAYYTTDRIEYSDVDLPVHTINEVAVKLLWPERWPWATLQKKKHEMSITGQNSGAFVKEYLNDPAGEDSRKFKASWLWNKNRRITMENFINSTKVMNGYCAIDMADATTDGADFSGCLVMFIDADSNFYRVDVKREKRNILGVITLIFQIWEAWSQYGLIQIGVEKKAFEDQIKPLLEEEMVKRNIFPNVTELKHLGRSKENRILGNLQGRYENQRIWTVGKMEGDQFIAAGHTEVLLNELYNFPKSAHDDLSDAEAYAVEMCQAPNAAYREQAPVGQVLDDPFHEASEELRKVFEQDEFTGRGMEDDPF